MIIGVTGMPASGKTVFSDIAQDMGFKIVKMGRVFINEICSRYGVDPSDAHAIRTHMTKIREKEGPEVVAKYCLSKIRESGDKIIVDGIRSRAEADYFKTHFSDFITVSIWSSAKCRIGRSMKRIGERSDAETTEEGLKYRDEQEIKVGVPDIMAMSDYCIVNELEYDAFVRKCEEFLGGFK